MEKYVYRISPNITRGFSFQMPVPRKRGRLFSGSFKYKHEVDDYKEFYVYPVQIEHVILLHWVRHEACVLVLRKQLGCNSIWSEVFCFK
jgi:hypothetical protein